MLDLDTLSSKQCEYDMNLIIGILNYWQSTTAAKNILERINPKKFYVLSDDDNETSSCLESMTNFAGKSNYLFKINLDSKDITLYDENILAELPAHVEELLSICHRFTNRKTDENIINLYKTVLYWSKIIEKDNIEALILQVLPHTPLANLLYYLCKNKKIKSYIIYPSLVPGYSFVFRDIKDSKHEVKDEYLKLLRQYAEKDIADIFLPPDHEALFNKFCNPHSDLTPEYMKRTISPPKLKKIKRVENNGFLNQFLAYWKSCEDRGIENKISFFVKTQLQKKVKYSAKELTKMYFKKWDDFAKKPDLEKKYIYVPLHLQPEATTLPMGGLFKNQELLVQVLSECVPDDVYLYVKENPKQDYRFRNMDYPNYLNNMKNVVLMPRDFDTYKLIDNCVAVASVTGTALWEGIWKNKPGIMFGHFLTQYAPGIFKVNTKDECKKIVDRILDENENTEISQKELKLFLLALSKNTFLGQIHWGIDVDNRDIPEQERVDAICNAFIKEINIDFNTEY